MVWNKSKIKNCIWCWLDNDYNIHYYFHPLYNVGDLDPWCWSISRHVFVDRCRENEIIKTEILRIYDEHHNDTQSPIENERINENGSN